MKYEKATAEVIRFDFNDFVTTSGDTPIGSFTCGRYSQGGSCNNISWQSGYTCGSYSQKNCQNVTVPKGSVADGCTIWSLSCSKF